MALDNNNLALALAGIITQVSDNDTTNTTDQSDDDQLDVDVPIEDSFNDEDTVEESFNSDDDGNFSNNSSEFDYDLKVEDALNGNGDNRDNDNNGDNRDNDYSSTTDVDTKVEDSLNDNGNFRNNDLSTDLDVKLEDAFNVDDEDILDLDNVQNLDDILTAGGDLLSNMNGVAVFGDGNAFDIDQTNSLSDQDSLISPTVANNGLLLGQGGLAEGGTSEASSSWDDASESARVTANAHSSADGVIQSEAFTQNIVMGANIQYNSIDMSVVGGADAGDAIGDAA
jgi:hypothetical protein